MHNSFASVGGDGTKKHLFNHLQKEKVEFITKVRASRAFLPVLHKKNANIVTGILFLVTVWESIYLSKYYSVRHLYHWSKTGSIYGRFWIKTQTGTYKLLQCLPAGGVLFSLASYCNDLTTLSLQFGVKEHLGPYLCILLPAAAQDRLSPKVPTSKQIQLHLNPFLICLCQKGTKILIFIISTMEKQPKFS